MSGETPPGSDPGSAVWGPGLLHLGYRVGMIEWLPAAALVGMAAWFSVKAAFERAESALQQIQHEQFWGDGMTADGSWAEALHGQGVSATATGVVASYEDRRAIQSPDVEHHSHRAKPRPYTALTPPEDVGL